MPNFRTLLVCACLLAAQLPRHGHATTLQALTLSQLAARSDAVVTARVGTSASEWRNGTIHTLTQVEVLSVHKGQPPQVLAVVQLGGRVGTRTALVAGTARLQEGDVAVLFLRMSGRGEHVLTGMSQGVLHVQPDQGLLWAPTAPLWDGAAVHDAPQRRLTVPQLLREIGVAP